MTNIDKAIQHGEREGAADYQGRAEDVDAGRENASWAWPFAGADDAYVSALGTSEICRRAGIDTDAWDEVSDAWLAAFRRGYEAAHVASLEAQL